MGRALAVLAAILGLGAAAPAGADAGTLSVRWFEVGPARAVEGYQPFIRLTVGRRIVTTTTSGSLRRRLRTGTYGVHGWWRSGCGPDCLDPPSRHCSAAVRVPRAGGLAKWTVEANLGAGTCQVRRGHMSDYLQRRTDAATRMARRRGRVLRVVVRDGEPLAVTEDFSDDRINVETSGGVVTRVVSVG